MGRDRLLVVTGHGGSGDDGTVAAVLRLADLAGQIELVEGAATRRMDELARDCAAAQEQVDAFCGLLAALTGRADEIEQHLGEASPFSAACRGRSARSGYRLNAPPPVVEASRSALPGRGRPAG